MSIGVPEERFWGLTARKLKPYVLAHDMKREDRNYEMWLQGLYVYKAFETVTYNANRKKGDQPIHYMDKPVPLTKQEAEQREEQKQKVAAKVNSTKFGLWADRLEFAEPQTDE